MNAIAKIDKEIARLEREKERIQKKCSHPVKTTVKGGDEGNILTGRDPSYWQTHTCGLCGKVWTESQ